MSKENIEEDDFKEKEDKNVFLTSANAAIRKHLRANVSEGKRENDIFKSLDNLIKNANLDVD